MLAICESGLLDGYFEEAENAHQDYIIVFDHGNTCQLVHWEGIDCFEWSVAHNPALIYSAVKC